MRFCAMRFAIRGGSISGLKTVRPMTRERAAFLTAVGIVTAIALGYPNLLVSRYVIAEAMASMLNMKPFSNANSTGLLSTYVMPAAIDPHMIKTIIASSARDPKLFILFQSM